MLKLFRSDPLKKLEKRIASKLVEARDAQRSGNIPRFAVLSDEVNDLGRQLDALRRDRSRP